MKRVNMLGCALAAALLPAAPAQARDQLGQSDPVVIDPAKAYIFFRAEAKANLRFLYEMTPAQREADATAKAAAFAKARPKLEKQYARWQKEDAAYRRAPLLARQQMGSPGLKPPTTLAEFPWPAPEFRNLVDVMAGREFSKDETGRTYFIAVEPGTYMLYGQLTVTENGAVGTCLCMGSVKFEAKAGRIVDLGRIEYPRENRSGDYGRVPSHRVIPPGADLPLPERLAGRPVDPADLRAADKRPNYFGVIIDRLEAIPGVLGYQRDRVVDLKGESEAAEAGTR
jgi:hypothetical protein